MGLGPSWTLITLSRFLLWASCPFTLCAHAVKPAPVARPPPGHSHRDGFQPLTRPSCHSPGAGSSGRRPAPAPRTGAPPGRIAAAQPANPRGTLATFQETGAGLGEAGRRPRLRPQHRQPAGTRRQLSARGRRGSCPPRTTAPLGAVPAAAAGRQHSPRCVVLRPHPSLPGSERSQGQVPRDASPEGPPIHCGRCRRPHSGNSRPRRGGRVGAPGRGVPGPKKHARGAPAPARTPVGGRKGPSLPLGAAYTPSPVPQPGGLRCRLWGPPRCAASSAHPPSQGARRGVRPSVSAQPAPRAGRTEASRTAGLVGARGWGWAGGAGVPARDPGTG